MMNIQVIVGSPRKNGATAALAGLVAESAAAKGHAVSTHYLYDLSVKPCVACDACTNRKVEICVHDDSFTKVLAPAIIKADALIVASPVYMGHISGPTKTFLDRWYTFADEKFAIRHVQGKKFVPIITMGAPAGEFAKVADYLEYWFGTFFKLSLHGRLVAGELHDIGDVDERPELIEQAKKLGSSF